MNAAKQAIWLCCTLIALACSATYFVGSTPQHKLDDKTLAQSADIVISALRVQQFNETGKIAHHLQTPELKHIPKNNIHLIQAPLISVWENGEPWKISANHAKAINGGQQITFIKDVVIHQAKSENSQESKLKTERLTYFSKTKIATTKLPVRFEQPGSVVHSKGMKAYLAEKRVLLSNARAIYEPNHA